MPEDDSLWVVVNNPPSLWQYTPQGVLKQRIDIGWLKDTEGEQS